MRVQLRPVSTNLTPVNVVGIPGLTLVVVAIALALQFPEARWLVLAGLVGGTLVAIVLIRVRQKRSNGDDGDQSHGILMTHDRPSRGRDESSSAASGSAQVWLPALRWS